MTLKKNKKQKQKLFRSGGFLRSVGRGQSNNLFFLALRFFSGSSKTLKKVTKGI